MPASRDASRSAEPILIFTDGSALGNPGPGGYGVIIRDGGAERTARQGYRHTTNNRMEIMAVLHGLRDTAKEGAERPTIVESDSQYVVNAIQQNWLGSWVRNNWKRTKHKVPVKNSDLWKEMIELMAGRDVKAKWVKGHSGNAENDRCDEMANAAARWPESKRVVDRVYERESGIASGSRALI